MKIGGTFIPETISANIQTVELPDGSTCTPGNIYGRTVPLVNIENQWNLVPTVKSCRYTYLHHRDAISSFVNNVDKVLDNYPERPDIQYKVKFYNNYAKMLVHAIPEIDYKLDNIEPFETQLPTTYYKSDNGNANETFRPRITMINDFNSTCIIEFGLFRSICKNGMAFGRVLKNRVRFTHLDRKIENTFQVTTKDFLDNIFDKHLIETIFNNLNSKEVEKDAFMETLEGSIGVRARKAVDNTFDMENARSTITLWVAYNILTWALTHKIKNELKAHHLAARFMEKYIGG